MPVVTTTGTRRDPGYSKNKMPIQQFLNEKLDFGLFSDFNAIKNDFIAKTATISAIGREKGFEWKFSVKISFLVTKRVAEYG